MRKAAVIFDSNIRQILQMRPCGQENWQNKNIDFDKMELPDSWQFYFFRE